MIRERIAENIYWFQSEIYALVTAGAIIGPEWAVLVDTMAVPQETLEMRGFIEDNLGIRVRYIINTIYHADHTFGNCFFPGAVVIGHSACRKMMKENNYEALKSAQRQSSIFSRVKIALPGITFESGTLTLQIGKRHIKIFPSPGATSGAISVLVREDRVLFAGDAFLPLPNIVEGDIDELSETIKSIGKMSLENIVQGHGDMILRGEIEQAIKSNLDYLSFVKKVAKAAAKRKDPRPIIKEATVEASGKSRVLLGGLATELHERNLSVQYQRERAAREAGA